jgi:hypothetical protein
MPILSAQGNSQRHVAVTRIIFAPEIYRMRTNFLLLSIWALIGPHFAASFAFQQPFALRTQFTINSQKTVEKIVINDAGRLFNARRAPRMCQVEISIPS